MSGSKPAPPDTDTSLPDEKIVELFFARDEAAISESHRKYGHYLMTVAGNVLHSHEDAEECVSDAYLNAWNSIPPERPHSLGAYLTKLVRSLAVNRYNRDRRDKRIPPEALESLSELEGILSDSPWEREEDARIIGAVISRYLRSCKERRRYIFMARYYALHPVGEIAVKLGISESAVKRECQAIRRELRKELEKEGISV
jgi:RNA polymerase sigma-70 factor (ECF subfamily)